MGYSILRIVLSSSQSESASIAITPPSFPRCLHPPMNGEAFARSASFYFCVSQCLRPRGGRDQVRFFVCCYCCPGYMGVGKKWVGKIFSHPFCPPDCPLHDETQRQVTSETHVIFMTSEMTSKSLVTLFTWHSLVIFTCRLSLGPVVYLPSPSPSLPM